MVTKRNRGAIAKAFRDRSWVDVSGDSFLERIAEDAIKHSLNWYELDLDASGCRVTMYDTEAAWDNNSLLSADLHALAKKLAKETSSAGDARLLAAASAFRKAAATLDGRIRQLRKEQN